MSDAALLESVVVTDHHGWPIHHGDHVKVHVNDTQHHKGHVSYTLSASNVHAVGEGRLSSFRNTSGELAVHRMASINWTVLTEQ